MLQNGLRDAVLDDFKMLLGSSDMKLTADNIERLANACLVVNALGPKVSEPQGKGAEGEGGGGQRWESALPAGNTCTLPGGRFQCGLLAPLTNSSGTFHLASCSRFRTGSGCWCVWGGEGVLHARW